MEVLVATNNRSKLREMRQIARPYALCLVSPAERGLIVDVEETGASFDDNALIKARALHRLAGGWVMADDSGLAVDSLGGAPGIRTARYAGEGAGDEANYRLLLAHLADEPDRRAHFHCSLALIAPDGRERLYHGRTDGVIALAPEGREGFGYDPVFIPEGENRTLAQMSAAEKHAISHRGRALRRLLEDWLSGPGWPWKGDRLA